MPTTTNFNIASCPFAHQACVTPTDNGTYVAFTSTANGNVESAIDFFGTGLTINQYQASEVSVDDGVYTSLDSGGVFAQQTTCTGLSNAWHRLLFKGLVAINDTNTLVVTSDTTPALRAPAWYGTSYRVLAAAVDAAIKSYGTWYEASAYDSLLSGGYWGGGLVITTAGANTNLRLFGYSAGANRRFNVYVDGVFNATVDINVDFRSNASTSGSVDLLPTPLTPGAHVYDLRESDSGDLANLFLCCVSAVGGTVDTTVTPDYGTVICTAGDSITQNSNSDAPASATALVAVMAANLGGSYSAMNAGHAGDKCPTGQALTDLVNAILRRRPKNLLIYFGENDKAQSVSAATFKTNTQALLQMLYDGTVLHAGLRTTTGTDKICVTKPFPHLNSLDSGYATAVTDAIAAVTPPANASALVAIPTAGRSKYSTGFDVVHITVANTAVWANDETAWGAASGVTTNGTSGTVTVTRAGGTQFDGTETVMLDASAGTITATAAGTTPSGNGTGTVVVTPASGQTSFTYTATATATITYTNGQGWTNPAATSYLSQNGKLLMKRRRCAA